MDSHGEYLPLEMSRLLRSGLDCGSGGSAGSNGGHPTSVSEFRAATPTSLTMAHYHNRYGLPSAMPGSNFAVMSSLLSGAHTSESRKALLIDFQQYWSAHADSFPRYLMAGGLYHPYPPILPGTAESLSLLGAGVACVAGGASAGPAPSHQVAHYQRLLEMQKEAYLVSMSAAAANHHSALYGMNANAMPPFLDHTPFPSHGTTPFSLVKQEPRELSCAEKTNKQAERRSSGFKVDLDQNRGNKETLSTSQSSPGSTHSSQTKEPKLSPSTSSGISGKADKRSGSSSVPQGSISSGTQSGSKLVNNTSGSSIRQKSHSIRAKCRSPSSKSASHALTVPSSKVPESCSSKKTGAKASLNVIKNSKTSTAGQGTVISNGTCMSSPNLSESLIVSVPTQAASPIPLATVQHDGVLLSALASPSSAAASLASAKQTVLKQHTDTINRTFNGNKELPEYSGKCLSKAKISDGAVNIEQSTSEDQSTAEKTRDVESTSIVDAVQAENCKLHSDDSSDIVVDSTENDEVTPVDRSPDISKSEQDQTIEETVENHASSADSLMESDQDDILLADSVKMSTEASHTPTLLSVSRIENSHMLTSLGSSTGTRTVYAKTKPVPSITVAGCAQMTSSITTQAVTSALPYYHTLYSKPEGVRRVHATTFVPEVGIFKGPSIKAITKTPPSASTSGIAAMSSESRCRLDPRSAGCIYSFPADGHCRARDSTPSPSLLSPSLVSHSSSGSPGIALTTTEISSSVDSLSLDSASVRSQSVASFRSVPEVDYSDSTSDEEESGHTNNPSYEKNPKTDIQQESNRVKCVEYIDSRDPDDDNDDEKNDEVVDEDECFNKATSIISSNERTSRKANDSAALSDMPVPHVAIHRSFSKLENSAVPSDVSDNSGCTDSAIDYSLPKICSSSNVRNLNSSRDVSARISNSSQISQTNLANKNSGPSCHRSLLSFKECEQTPQTKTSSVTKSFTRCNINYSLSSATKLITSPTKPLIHHDMSWTPIGKPIHTHSSPQKRLNLTTNHRKPNVLTTPHDVLSKFSRRLKMAEDRSTKRCGSAPPSSCVSYVKPLTNNLLPASNSVNEKELNLQEKVESSSGHCLGSNIPVGIAVAQIRPHHIQQMRECLTTDSVNTEVRLGHASANTKNITQTTTSIAASATALAPNLVVAGPINSSPWLQQMPFTIHQTMNSSGATFDSGFPITAPSGFKFAHNSLTGQFFIVPNGDFVERANVWSATNFVPPSGSGSTHYQTNINLPVIAISGPDTREGHLKAEQCSTGKSTALLNTPHNIIPEQDVIIKDRIKGGDQHISASHAKLDVGSNNPSLATTNTATVNPIAAVSPPMLFKGLQGPVESRGCSPIVFENISACLPLLSSLPVQSFTKVTTCSIGVQTGEDLTHEDNSSSTELMLHDQAVQASSPDLSKLNPLSVQCPDLDSVNILTQTLEVKSNTERISYNPFTDPQILQAADGLELLSALAEKRTKCTSVDDPKRIFPSPSDSFKSDSASIAAIEDTLSPGDTELKSGHCTPRREVRRDVSPKWSLSKKEPPVALVFADFKTPSEVDTPDDSEVRVKLAEVQRQYKEKQKKLAKLQSKKSEENKPFKRGPGRPPKTKVLTKKSDDESSSSSSKTKDHHQPQKKKRKAEELVDRVFRKLPPVIKPSKVSRSIHYVKSKTGPFFRRKSASSSVKRNKDLFGFDESNWPSFSERKHQEKIKHTESFSDLSSTGKSKSKLRFNSSHNDDSKHSHDAGNIFTNLESFRGDFVKKHHSLKHRTPLSASGTISAKTEPCPTLSHQDTGLGLLAKFALTVSTTLQSSTSVSLSLSSLTTTTLPTSVGGNLSSASSFSNSTFSSCINSSNNYCTSLYNSGTGLYNMNNTNSGSFAPGITFGSLSSIMSSPSSGLMNFSSPALGASSLHSNTPTTTSSTFAPSAVLATPTSLSITSPTLVSSVPAPSSSPLFASPGAHHSFTEESSSGTSSTTTTNSGTSCFGTTANCTNSSSSTARELSPVKRKHEEDSDTDTSDTSPNKKRKPGRPRKINPEKSLGGTETIWAKKSSTIGLMQVDPSCSQTKDGNPRKMDPSSMKPLFLDEEWTRRRSERIFLNEPSPLSSPTVSPLNRGEPIWKLSNFMPKSKKPQDANKSNKEGEDKDKIKGDSSKDQPSTSLGSLKNSTFVTPAASSNIVGIKTEVKEHLSASSVPSTSGTSWSAVTKTTEISTPRMEDTKMIVKLEDSVACSSGFSWSSVLTFEKSQKVSAEKDCSSKKKLSERVKQGERLSSSPTNPKKDKKERQSEQQSKIKLQKAKSLHDLTQRVKKKYSKTDRKKREDKLKDSRKKKTKRKISTDSSDTDNLPLVSYKEAPTTPEPRSCKLQPSDLREGLKVLYLIDGLFHEGTVKALQPPDVYGVLTAGQRGNRPHILCLEEILKWAVMDVKPNSARYLPEGTRVCAFWSQQFSCLYPGTVAKSIPVHIGKKVVIPVEFDDGDNGRIELDHIRLLPADFPIVEYEPDPLEVLPKRKQRSLSDASDVRKSLDKEANSSKRTKMDEEGDDDDDYDDSKTDADSDDSGPLMPREAWRWAGKCTKKPGMKGKAKKIFYKAITRGKETISVGDSAVFVSKDRVDCPYIGRIESLWEGWNGQMMVKVFWYYHPEETHSNRKLSDPKNALFESQHEDENDVQTIAYKCLVVTHAHYLELVGQSTSSGVPLEDVFYLAGFYDPAAKNITFYHGVS